MLRLLLIFAAFSAFFSPASAQRIQVAERYNDENNAAMIRDVTDTLIPWVERHDRAASGADHRAIAGLSVGGGHHRDVWRDDYLPQLLPMLFR